MSNNKTNQITDYKTDNITTNVLRFAEFAEYVIVFVGKFGGIDRK